MILAGKLRELESRPRRWSLLRRHYDWPGNVRELENVLEYSCVVCQGDTVEFADLPPHFGGIRRAIDKEGATGSREQLREVLERHGWNRTRAAQALGISRVTLWKRLKACGLTEPGGGMESNPTEAAKES